MRESSLEIREHIRRLRSAARLCRLTGERDDAREIERALDRELAKVAVMRAAGEREGARAQNRQRRRKRRARIDAERLARARE